MDEPDTARICEACGASINAVEACPWCVNGHQSQEQRESWRRFRKHMRSMSGTYQLLQELVQELINRLEQSDYMDAKRLAADGKMLLHWWVRSPPDSGERENLTRRLAAFQRSALDLMGKELFGRK